MNLVHMAQVCEHDKNLRFSLIAGNSLSAGTTLCFTRRTQPYELSYTRHVSTVHDQRQVTWTD
jgi:hypothetical protein